MQRYYSAFTSTSSSYRVVYRGDHLALRIFQRFLKPTAAYRIVPAPHCLLMSSMAVIKRADRAAECICEEFRRITGGDWQGKRHGITILGRVATRGGVIRTVRTPAATRAVRIRVLPYNQGTAAWDGIDAPS
jgi:hypothetical protein